MSEHQDHQHHDHLEPESSAVRPKPVFAFLAILTVATAFVFVLIYGLLWALDKRREADQTPPATRVELPEGQRKLPPEPRLQGAPGPDGPSLLPLDDWRDYKQKVDHMAASYGWVDKSAGIARIPIERAKDLVAEKGLPLLSDTAQRDFEAAQEVRRAAMAAESSAGRLIRPATTPTPAVPAASAAPTPAAPAAQGAAHGSGH